jgi:hypothetical protein
MTVYAGVIFILLISEIDTPGTVYYQQIRKKGFYFGLKGNFKFSSRKYPGAGLGKIRHLPGTGFVIMRTLAGTHENQSLRKVAAYTGGKVILGQCT